MEALQKADDISLPGWVIFTELGPAQPQLVNHILTYFIDILIFIKNLFKH